MGPVVTINSATLVNKGLEVIEAHELFGVAYDDIEVMVHPQSVIHSMVEFADGSTIAQCSPPDMRLPIALALGWPDRVAGRRAAAVDWTTAHTWELAPARRRGVPGGARWPRRPAGRAAAGRRSTTPPTRSAWPAFTAGGLPFLGIVDTVERVLDEAPDFAEPGTVEDVLAAESWARARARELIAGRLSTREGSLMAYALGIVVFAVGILVSVCLHEAGHMLTAKAFGMKVTRYFIGFGPTILSFRRGRDRVRR